MLLIVMRFMMPITGSATTTKTTTPTGSKALVPSATSATGNYWVPPVVTSWQWQLSFDEGESTIDMSIPADVYIIDGGENPRSTVDTLHARGRHVVCYLSAGSWENYRPDADQFPAQVLGNTLDGWPDEKWLDIRRIDLLAPIIMARLDTCKEKGFDGIEPDNIDGYANESGFPLTYEDQITYNRWLAQEAHRRGLSIALKNDGDQAADLWPDFDFAINEQCFEYDECAYLTTYFVNKGKAAFQVEYTLSKNEFCPQANALNFNSLKKPADFVVNSDWNPCR